MLGARSSRWILRSGGRARERARGYTYLLRVFIIPATGIFIVITMKRARARERADPGARPGSHRGDECRYARTTGAAARSRVLLGTSFKNKSFPSRVDFTVP